MRAYISLFSSAGVGCYGFQLADFECVATNELLKERLEVQRINGKCKYDTGYICGDARSNETHQRIFDEIDRWKENEGLKRVDVVFATPPCQGISSVNYKKHSDEIKRNSLVVEVVKLIKEIRPKVFVIENVRSFMATVCTDIDGNDTTIAECILRHLSGVYRIEYKVINFCEYGVPSSRPRTLVIGVDRELDIDPVLLFPQQELKIPLRESIGKLEPLGYREKSKTDPFHFARPFPEYMLEWIADLKEGETAFNNPPEKRPYHLDKHGNRVTNEGAYIGNKYRRLFWDRPGACVHTRSDCLSSQDTIHPRDNRVLSIRELMILMTIPVQFKWTEEDEGLWENISDEKTEAYLKKHEMNIRRCIGEAVPTRICYDIAELIKKRLGNQ